MHYILMQIQIQICLIKSNPASNDTIRVHYYWQKWRFATYLGFKSRFGTFLVQQGGKTEHKIAYSEQFVPLFLIIIKKN